MLAPPRLAAAEQPGRWLVALAAALAVAGWAARAGACVKLPQRVFSLDPALQGVDIAPPSSPTVIAASVTRWAGEFCRGGTCVSSSCGDNASVELRFAPSEDDRTEPARLGYRLKQVSGNVPPALRLALSTTMQGPATLDASQAATVFIDVPYQEVVQLDATFELVAVDGAGNESAPSEPLYVAFDGCTRAPDLDGCIEDVEAETSCALMPAGRARAGGWVLLIVAGTALSRRRRAVSLSELSTAPRAPAPPRATLENRSRSQQPAADRAPRDGS